MVVYTKSGDDGYTTIGRKSFCKSDLYIRVMGAIDFLLCDIDNAITIFHLTGSNNKIKHFLKSIRREVKLLIAELYDRYAIDEEITPDSIKALEKKIDSFDTGIDDFQFFNTICSNALNHCRVSTRHVESLLVELFYDTKSLEFRKILLQYINRLSDYFFVTAVYMNKEENDINQNNGWKRWLGLEKR